MPLLDEQTRDKLNSRSRTTLLFITSTLLNSLYLLIWVGCSFGLGSLIDWMKDTNPDACAGFEVTFKLLKYVFFAAGCITILLSYYRDIRLMYVQTKKAIEREENMPFAYGAEPKKMEDTNPETKVKK